MKMNFIIKVLAIVVICIGIVVGGNHLSGVIDNYLVEREKSHNRQQYLEEHQSIEVPDLR